MCGRPSSETVTGSGSGAITKKRANPGPCAQSAAWLELACRPAASGGNQPWQKSASVRRGSRNGGCAVDAPRTKVVTGPSVADGFQPWATSPRQAIQAVFATNGLSV